MRQNRATTHLLYASQPKRKKEKKKRNKFTEWTGHLIEWPLKGLNCVGKYSTQWHFKYTVAHEVSESKLQKQSYTLVAEQRETGI